MNRNHKFAILLLAVLSLAIMLWMLMAVMPGSVAAMPPVWLSGTAGVVCVVTITHVLLAFRNIELIPLVCSHDLRLRVFPTHESEKPFFSMIFGMYEG